FIRDNAGSTGQPVSNISQYINILNNAFNVHNIHFISIGHDEINNSTLADSDYNFFAGFSSITMNHRSDAINIYLFRSDKPDSLSGGIATLPGTRVAIGGGSFWEPNYTLSNVLSHEVGHALNLLHTHQGTDGSAGCAENPDGSNGTTCGDEVADTPADPNINFSNAGNCINPFTIVSGGITYNPDPTNIMSYATANCLSHFTAGQGARMDNAAAGLTVLQPIRANINGPGTLCTSGTYSIVGGVPSGTTVSWSTSNGSAATINSSGVATRVGSFSGNVAIIALLTNSNGCSMAISFPVWVGPPNVDNILPSSPICTGDIQQLTAFPLPQGPGTSYSWLVHFPSSGGFVGATNLPSVDFQDFIAETSHISVAAINVCGSSGADLFLTTMPCLLSYTIYPNPAKYYITIEFEKPVNVDGLPDEIAFYSDKSTIALQTVNVHELFSQKAFINGNQIQINAKDLPRGIYYLHVKYGNRNEPNMHRVILQ